MLNEKGFKYVYRCVLLFSILLIVGGVVYTIVGSGIGIPSLIGGILMLVLYDMGMRIRTIEKLLKKTNVREDEENNSE